jgi:hypothetical protein
MAKTKISEYSATASNNTDINGIDIAEGCAPSGINNAIRELMAQLKDQQTGTDADNFTVGGNLSVTGTTTATGGITTISTPGNIAFTGTANRITGDFTNATTANRVLFQTSTANSPTYVGIIPNGSSQISAIAVGNSSSAVNTSYGILQQVNTATRLEAAKDGTGTYGDLEFWTNGVKQAYFKSSGALTGNLLTTGAIQAAEGIGAADAAIEIGANRTADGNSYIDFHSVAGAGDYDFRILRVSGANGYASIANEGTGGMYFYTNGVQRAVFDSAGITGNLVGNATTASNAIGFNQTWQDLTASRAAGTTYTNSTGRPISVSVRVRRDDCWLELYIDSLLISVFGETAGHAQVTVSGIVPAGSTYRVESIYGGTLNWYELR